MASEPTEENLECARVILGRNRILADVWPLLLKDIALTIGIAEATAIATEREQQWQPIETAPKDGSHVLLGRKLPWSSSSNVCVAFWLDEHQTDFPHWQSDSGHVVVIEVYRYWMPLPAPPAIRNQSEEKK